MRKSINAVYGDEIVKTLERLKEKDRVLSGKAKCKICNCSMTIDNIFVLFPESGDVKYICTSPLCIAQSNYLTR